jgi:hypothetical protein
VNPFSDFKMSSDGGTIAFVTIEPLVREDVNQTADVYEWRDGASHLVSDGVRAFQEGFSAPQVRAVSDDGSSILFIVAELGLTGFEQDGLANLYVARVGGGFEPPPPPTHCSEEACQGPLAVLPASPDSASTAFSGRGNLKEGQGRKPRCAKGKVRRRGRCVHRHKRQHQKHQRAGHAKQGRTK